MTFILKVLKIFSLIPIFSAQDKRSSEQELVCLVSHVKPVLYFLKKDFSLRFNVLSAVSGVDFLGKKHRFLVVYDLLSMDLNRRIRLKVFVNEGVHMPTVTSIFKNASWWEREIWDMFGIHFKKHPDMRRLLTDYIFEGHPLRKDFPLTGFVECVYSEKISNVAQVPVSLTQDFRVFKASGSLSHRPHNIFYH